MNVPYLKKKNLPSFFYSYTSIVTLLKHHFCFCSHKLVFLFYLSFHSSFSLLDIIVYYQTLSFLLYSLILLMVVDHLLVGKFSPLKKNPFSIEGEMVKEFSCFHCYRVMMVATMSWMEGSL